MAYVFENQESLVKDNDIGLGVEISNSTIVFNPVYDLKKQVKQNIKTLLLTRIGERYMLPQFGTDLLLLIFQPNVTELKEQIITIITDAMNSWINNITLERVDVKTNEDDPTLNYMIEVSIIYTIQNFVTDTVTISATEAGTVVVSNI